MRCKEVININDGSRLGYAGDAEIDITTGRIVSIIIPGSPRLFGFFNRYDDIIIPWGDIEKFGDDVILVNYKFSLERLRERRRPRLW